MKEKAITSLYFLTGTIHLGTSFFDIKQAEHISKIALMPILIYYIYATAQGKITLPRLLLAVGIIFSWFGDILLLYCALNDWYFLGGLTMFLIAQVVYATVFNKSTYDKLRFDAAKLIPVFILAFVMATRIIPSTGNMMAPVIAYSICLFSMLGYAKLREGLTSKLSYILVLIGAVLFVVSDSLIAFNKFVTIIPYASIWIMSTYIPAQYLIIKGVMTHEQ